ncbi:hypothetical protein [Motilibacter peucedani]|nr:hypothetical protein [Motilibacter peucedani]
MSSRRTRPSLVLRRTDSPVPLQSMVALGEMGAGVPAGDRVWTAREMRAQEWVEELAVEDETVDVILDTLEDHFGDTIPVAEVVIGCSLVDGPVLGVANEDVVLGAEDALLELAEEDDLEVALRKLVFQGDIVALDNGVFVAPGLVAERD